jgi:hypothetical protein
MSRSAGVRAGRRVSHPRPIHPYLATRWSRLQHLASDRPSLEASGRRAGLVQGPNASKLLLRAGDQRARERVYSH